MAGNRPWEAVSTTNTREGGGRTTNVKLIMFLWWHNVVQNLPRMTGVGAAYKATTDTDFPLSLGDEVWHAPP